MRFWHFGLLVALLGLSLVGCSGKIEGTVFLDGNANSLADSQEQTLTNLNLKITHNGKLLTTTSTNSRGKFATAIQESGYYCVEVNEPHINESVLRQLNYGRIPQGAISSAMSNVSLGPAVGMAAKQVVISPTTPAPATPAPTAPAPASPPSSPQPLSPSQPDRIEPGIVCKNTSDFTLNLQIPVSIDYETDVARMPPHIKQERRSGELFTVSIPVSIGCVLETLYVSDGLEPLWPLEPSDIGKILSIDRVTGRIEFRPASQSTFVVLPLKVREDLPLGTYSVTLTPFMLCPGDQRIALPEIPIDLLAEPLIEIFQELPSGSQPAGSAITWKIFVKNKGSREYDVTVSGDVTNSSISTLTPESTECHTVGSARVECRVTLEPDQIKELIITARLDNTAETAATYNASAMVEGSDIDLTAPPADVRFDAAE